MRTAMIYFMGIQYLGLNSLFVSVLQVLNLAELGVGSAMVFSMYKPIAEDDYPTICALMNMYRSYYRLIGIVIACIGTLIIPFIPKLISGSIPEDINIYVLYCLYLGSTVLSYWLFAYKNSILLAYQRNDVISKISLVACTVQYGLQLFMLSLFHNYYGYIIVMLMMQAFSNVATAIIADRMYPYFKPNGTIEKKEQEKIKQRIKDLFTSKIGGIIYDSADTIVISAFMGLTALAVYQNYFYILNSVSGFIYIIFASCTAGIGNSIVVESKEKNVKDLSKFTFIICWISGFCSCCLLCLYQPFMELWVGEDYMLAFSAVICFVVYFFCRQLNTVFNVYKDASGMWHEDKYRPLAAALTNLILNLILVQFMGLYGVLLSTVLAILCVGMPWLLHNLFAWIFEKKDLRPFIKKLIFYCIMVAISCVVCYLVCSFVNLQLIPTIIIRAIICCIIPNLIFYLVYRRTEEFQGALGLTSTMTKGKIDNILRWLGWK